MISKKSLLITALLALTVSFNAAANKPIYKWKDNQGNIKYTQSKPPRGVQFETIYQRGGQPPEDAQQNSTQTAEEAAQDPLDETLAKQNAQKDLIAKKNAEIARKNCKIAKNNLEVLESRTRVQVEENGERRMLTDQEREDRLAKAKENINKHCK